MNNTTDPDLTNNKESSMEDCYDAVEADFQNLTINPEEEEEEGQVKSKQCLGKTLLKSFESQMATTTKSLGKLQNSILRKKESLRNKDKCCCKNSTRTKLPRCSVSGVATNVKQQEQREQQQKSPTKSTLEAKCKTLQGCPKMIKEMMKNHCNRRKEGQSKQPEHINDCDPKALCANEEQSKKIAHYPYVIYSSNPSVLCTLDRHPSKICKPTLSTRMVNSPFLKRFGKMYCDMDMDPEQLLSSVLDANNESPLMKLLMFAFSHNFLLRISFPCYFPKTTKYGSDQDEHMTDNIQSHELCVVDCSCRSLVPNQLEIWIRIFPSSNVRMLQNSPCEKPNFDVLRINKFNAPLKYTPLSDKHVTPEEQDERIKELHNALTSQFYFQLQRLVKCRLSKRQC